MTPNTGLAHSSQATDPYLDSLDASHLENLVADLRANYRPLPAWKRAGDVIGVCIAFVLLLPLLGFIALTIKLSSPGPILFRQKRVGGAGKLFEIWKFRTMTMDADAEKHKAYVASIAAAGEKVSKMDNSEHLLPLAKVWRAVGADELPQLFNVLLGEMSLVGPRPDVMSLEDYQPWQLRRFEVTPGITGYWQVKGKNRTTFDEMIQMDIDYVEQRSMWFDLKILLMTLPAVIRLAVD
jgi:lipopolysaccharide/colanic/teichoic acid biosynthesis glycosyltransferase